MGFRVWGLGLALTVSNYWFLAIGFKFKSLGLGFSVERDEVHRLRIRVQGSEF